MAQRSDVRLVLANTAGLVLSYGAAQGVQAVTGIVLAGHLGPSAFGIISIGLTLSIMLQTVASFGLPLYLLREVSANLGAAWRLTDASVVIRVAATLALALPCAAGLVILSPPSTRFPLLLFVAAAVPMAADVTHLFDTLGVARYQGYLLFGRWSAYAAILVLGFRSWPRVSPEVLVAASYLTSTALYVAGQCILAHKLVPRHHAVSVSFDRLMIKAALPFFVSNIAANVYVRSDVLLLGLFRNPAEVGYYTAAYQIIFAAWGVMTLFQRAQFPITCRRAGDRRGFVEWIRAMLNAGLASTLPVCLAAALWAPEVVTRLYGPTYAPSVLPFRILLGQLVFVGGFFILRHVLIASGNDAAYRNTSLWGAGLNLAPNLIVIPWIGMVGAACTTVLAEIATLIATVRALPVSILRDVQYVIAKHLTAAAACGIAVMTLQHLTPLRVGAAAVLPLYGIWALFTILRSTTMYRAVGAASTN